MTFANNYCAVCNTQLGMDDFHGICGECDESTCGECGEIIPVEQRAFCSEVCLSCREAGAPPDNAANCPECNGLGFVPRYSFSQMAYEADDCPTCGGEGWIVPEGEKVPA